MSLKGRGPMLGIDSQGEGRTRDEPGAGPGVLEGSDGVQFEGRNQDEVYQWVSVTLRHHNYGRMGRNERGVVQQYLEKDDRPEPGANHTSDCSISAKS